MGVLVQPKRVRVQDDLFHGRERPGTMTDYRILVTGSRDWGARLLIASELDALLSEHKTLTLVHGACPKGADAIAHDWACFRRLGPGELVITEPHPADWGTHGKRGGFIRNAEMVAAGADLALAFIAPCSSPKCAGKPAHGSHGATQCAALAEKAGIRVRRFTA